MTAYEKEIRGRSRIHFLVGLCARLLPWISIQLKIRKMRKQGATVGSNIAVGKGLTVIASRNLKIGDHVSIQTDRIDVRAPITIGNYVIIGDSSSIITCSHDIDAADWKFKPYGITIEDYVWIATRAIILPSCRKIGRGAVIGAGAVVANDVPPMAVVAGNPARIIRYRKAIHSEIMPEALLGGGLISYVKARFCSKK